MKIINKISQSSNEKTKKISNKVNELRHEHLNQHLKEAELSDNKKDSTFIKIYYLLKARKILTILLKHSHNSQTNQKFFTLIFQKTIP